VCGSPGIPVEVMGQLTLINFSFIVNLRLDKMPVIEEQGTYNGVSFKLTYYIGIARGSDVKMESLGIYISKIEGYSKDFDDIFEQINKRSREIKRQMIDGFGEFNETMRRPEDVLHDYGRNDFVLEYWWANHISGFESGRIVEAETESGKQALDLMGYFLNKFGRFPLPIPLSQVNFGVFEAQSNGRRCANLVTGVEHPPSIFDACNIYVAERG